jgi:hypothetical protein
VGVHSVSLPTRIDTLVSRIVVCYELWIIEPIGDVRFGSTAVVRASEGIHDITVGARTMLTVSCNCSREGKMSDMRTSICTSQTQAREKKCYSHIRVDHLSPVVDGQLVPQVSITGVYAS